MKKPKKKPKKKPRKTLKKIPTNRKLGRVFIKNINISNFKAFKKNEKVELAPMVNLVFGKNSSGKSTINQSIRLFRQSYGTGNLTPFNYESPNELKGNGGLDIDIGYSGIINDGDIKKNFSLGVETGIYSKEKREITDSRNLLEYEYKFVKNFYKGQNITKDKTILSKIKIANKGGEVEIDLPKHRFFKEKSKIGRDLSFYERFDTGSFFVSNAPEKSENIYESAYDPYYYKTSFDPKKIKIEGIKAIFNEINKININNLILLLNYFSKYLKEKQKNFKKTKKESQSKTMSKYEAHRNKLFPSSKKIKELRKESNNNIDKFILKLLDNKEATFAVLEDQFLDIINEEQNIVKDQRKKFISDIKQLINFLGKKSNLNEKKFYSYFTNDISKKNKNIVFFKGLFINNIKNIMNRRIFHTSELALTYLINIFAWILENNLKFDNIDILNSYKSERYGSRTRPLSILENIRRSMQKLLVVPGLRPLPKRYFVKGLQTSYVGPAAENLGELLVNENIKKETNKWFKKLEIPYEVDAQPSGNYYEIVFKPTISKIKIASMHVGLGYPVILPFIVQCIIAKNKIILIEEPEVHLHPKLEADLADLIVDSAKNRDNQFLIESHSEEFLLRILKSIRKGILKPEEVSVNYITLKKNGSKSNKIQINKFGQYFTPWKDNLFAERRREFSNKK